MVAYVEMCVSPSAQNRGFYTHIDENYSDYTQIYCNCGRFVPIDTKAYRRRLSLHKPIECVACRNARIAAEIEELDEHYNVIEPESDF